MIKQIINIENEDTDDLQYTCGYSAGTRPKNHPVESKTTKAPVWLRKVKLILRKAFAAFVSRLYFSRNAVKFINFLSVAYVSKYFSILCVTLSS